MTKLEKALQSYMTTFDKNYPLVAVKGMSDDKIIGDIKRCIQEGIPAEQPIFEDDIDY